MIAGILNEIEASIPVDVKIARAEAKIQKIDWSIGNCNKRLIRYAEEEKWDWAKTEYQVRDRLLMERFEQMQIIALLKTEQDQKGSEK